MTVSFDQLPDNARAWVYTSNRLLTVQEITFAEQQLQQFTADWSSHGRPLKASAQVFDQAIFVVAVEDGWDMASGCSIDKSVGALKDIEKTLNISLFDRLLILYKPDRLAPVSFASFSSLKTGLKEGQITFDGLIVNTQADNLKTVREGLWVDIKGSWLAKVVPAHIG
jgi:hypothetical protein